VAARVTPDVSRSTTSCESQHRSNNFFRPALTSPTITGTFDSTVITGTSGSTAIAGGITSAAATARERRGTAWICRTVCHSAHKGSGHRPFSAPVHRGRRGFPCHCALPRTPLRRADAHTQVIVARRAQSLHGRCCATQVIEECHGQTVLDQQLGKWLGRVGRGRVELAARRCAVDMAEQRFVCVEEALRVSQRLQDT
jgi:hypothetical protein